jgi:hypothetical protein
MKGSYVMNETLREDYKEIGEEAVDKAKEAGFRIGSNVRALMDKSFFKPMVVVVGITAAYCVGRRKGMKLGRIEYICDPDIKGNLETLFNRTAENLDLINEAIELSETKVTKF